MNTVSPGVSRWIRILLIASLALNVAFIGVFFGAGVVGRSDGRPVRSVEVAIGPLGQALSRDDRRRVGDMLRQDPSIRQNSRRALEAQMAEIVALLRADRFDSAAMAESLSALRARVGMVQDAAASALVTVISEMSDEEREALADDVEARLDRSRDGPRDRD